MPPAPKPAPTPPPIPGTPAPETKRPPIPWRIPGMGGGISQHDKAGKEAADQAKKLAEASLPGPLAAFPMLAKIVDNLGNPGFWRRAGQMALGVMLVLIGVILLISGSVAKAAAPLVGAATNVVPEGKMIKTAAAVATAKKETP